MLKNIQNGFFSTQFALEYPTFSNRNKYCWGYLYLAGCDSSQVCYYCATLIQFVSCTSSFIADVVILFQTQKIRRFIHTGSYLEIITANDFVGENTAEYWQNKKCAKPFGIKIRLCRLGRNGFCTKAWEKVAQWFAESNMIRVKIFAQPAQPVGQKNVILCFIANTVWDT